MSKVFVFVSKIDQPENYTQQKRSLEYRTQQVEEIWLIPKVTIWLDDIGGGMVFIVTLNNISVISWLLVLLVEESWVPGENHDHSQVTDKLYHIRLYRVHLTIIRFELTTLVVIGTCKSNYHIQSWWRPRQALNK